MVVTDVDGVHARVIPASAGHPATNPVGGRVDDGSEVAVGRGEAEFLHFWIPTANVPQGINVLFDIFFVFIEPHVSTFGD